MNIKACIFDLDGTVANTLNDIAISLNNALAEHGYPIHENECYRYFMGNGVADMVRAALPEQNRDDETVRIVKDTYSRQYQEHYLDATVPFDGIRELLQGLKSMSISINVLSNKTDEFTKKIINKLFPDTKFDVVLGNVDYLPLKPEPKSSLFIADKIKVSPGNMLFIGDSDVDMQTAKASGMHGVGALWGFRTKEELLNNGAEYLAENPMDIISKIIPDIIIDKNK